MFFQHFIIQQIVYMRTRYFSPSTQDNLERFNKQRHLRKLRSIGSANKINIASYYQDDFEINIGPYTYFKNKVLGSGYSSKVYMAKKFGEDTFYAMKVINLKNYHTLNLSMLRNEIEILKTLNHPNVIKCYDIFKSRQYCYIVTEYCSGGDLHGFISRRGKIQEEGAINIIQSVIRGYKYLIGLNIIHRDLKPANILKSGNTWKIADFGFAIKSLEQIKTKQNVGTPLYMPLQSLINNLYSFRSDIFSIGVILFQLITGYTPWQSSTEKGLIKKMQTQKLRISDRHHISQKVKDLLNKMCEADCEKRMNEKQFTNLNIQTYEPCPRKDQRMSLISHKQPRLRNFMHKSAEILPQLKQRLSRPTFPDTEEEDQYLIKKMEIKNNYILVNQLHYCRFLYYFARNRQYLLLPSTDCDQIIMIVFRHLITLINQLSDQKNNWFKLQQWDKFKGSKRYKSTMLAIKEYSHRYQKQYSNFIKNIDSQFFIQSITQYGNPMQNLKDFTMQYYQKAISFLSTAIKNLTQVLSIALNQENAKYDIQQKGKVEALNVLYKFYELLCMGYANNSNYVHFEANGQIKIYTDFRNSNITIDNLREIEQKIENW